MRELGTSRQKELWLGTAPTGENFMSSPGASLTLENVLYEKKGETAYVTVNRPKVLNALNHGTWADLRTAFEDARDDPTVRGVIVTGAGDKAFIAGADISELASLTPLSAESSTRPRPPLLALPQDPPYP